MPKPSEAPQFGPILRAPIQSVKNASKQLWISVSESDNRELFHSWTQARFSILIRILSSAEGMETRRTRF